VVDADEAARVHERRIAGVADGNLIFTIVPDGASDPAGIVAIWRTEWESRPVHELGAMLLARYHGQGLVVRAVGLLLPRAVEAGVGELHSFPAVTNRPSNAVLQRLGFQRLEECDLDYEGRPIRCVHWLRDLRTDPPSAVT
jgi:RimJ/RimL family protein N-acetyltransferase